MGFGFLIVLLSIVALSTEKVLPASGPHDKRSAPDPLLGEIFNDPSATSLTKSDLNDNDASGSGVGSGADIDEGNDDVTSISTQDSGTQTQASATTDKATKTQDSNKVDTLIAESAVTEGSGSGDDATSTLAAQNSDNTADQTAKLGKTSPTTDKTKTDATPQKDSFVPSHTDSYTEQFKDTDMADSDSYTATEQKLPGVTRAQLDEQGKNSAKKSQVVAKANKKYDINAPFEDNVPQPTINSEYSPEAAFFADKIPLASDQASDQAPDQAPDQAQADSPSENKKEAKPDLEFPQTPAAGFSNNTQVPFAPNPMNASQFSPMAQPINDQLPVQQPASDQAAQLQQQFNNQLPVQQPASDQLAQLQQPFNDQAFQGQLNNQTAMAPELQQQINDQYGLAAQQQQQMSDQYGVTPQQPMVDQYGQPIAQPQQSPYGVLDASQQAVPIFQGQTPKKPIIEKDECADMFDSCPDMAKNKYCEKYVALMKVQCKKTCKFCEPKKKPIEDKSEGSGASLKDHSGSGLGDYVWDSSGSGEGSWDSSSSASDDMESKKSTIPSGLLKKVLAPKLQPKQDVQDVGSAASGFWDASGSGSEIQQEPQGESGSGLEKRTEIPMPDAGSGSGDEEQSAAEIESGSGAELAEDLATGTISKNVKHSVIPAAPIPDPLPAGPPAYPKIDLKEIAKAVSLYKHVALKMLGEAIKDGANEYAEEEAKRNNIPTMPSGTEILQDMGFPVEDPKSVVPNPLGPNFDNQNAYAYNPSEQTLDNFYGEQQPNVVKSDVAQPEEQPQANLTEPETPKEEEKTDDDSKKSEIDDPYQYVRNMGKGASLTPISARPGANLVLHKSSSMPLVLHKSSQWPSILAKKKTDIPKPSENVAMPNIADASQRYEVPQINMTAQSQQPAFDAAQAYSQYTPESQLLTESIPQEANLRSDLSTSAAQVFSQPQQEALSKESVPSQASIDKAVINTFFSGQPKLPVPKPFHLAPGSSRSFLDTGSQVHVSSAPLKAMYKAKSPQNMAGFRGNDIQENLEQADSTSSSTDSVEQALQGHSIDSDNQQASEIDGSLGSQITANHAPDDDIDNNANAFAAPQVEISGKITNGKNIDSETDEGMDGSKMFPNGGNLNKLEVSIPKYNQADSRGGVPELGARIKTYPPPAPLAHAQSPKDVNFYHSNLAEGQRARYQVTTDAYNNFLPPLNHATNEVLPPLNHGGLPPLNHKFTSENGYGQEDQLTGANLPPLNHGYLPPLNNKYTSENSYGETTGTARDKAPPIYPFTIPPEGEQGSEGFNGLTQKGKYQDPMQELGETRGRGRPSFPIPNFPPKEDGNPYPLPLPPEGDNDDDLMGNNGYGESYARQFPKASYSYGSTLIPEEPYTEGKTAKKNLIRPKPDLKCGDGWKGAYGDFGTFCYKEVYEHKTWDNAHGACRQFGGELFSVKNAYEQRFLENFTNIESWIGYRDKSIDGTWRWSDGNTAVYTNWDSSSVDDRSDRRDCVVLDAKHGKWRDAPCAQKHNFICKRNSDDCVKGWKRLSLNNIKGCYKLMNGTKSWEDAQEVCVDHGGDLASILSDDEQTMVAQVYSNENLWIGYNDKDNEGDWVWTDRMTSSYTNWDDKSPNNGGVTCAIVTRKGGWHDESCHNKYSFICRKPSPKNIPKYIHDMLPPVATLVANNSLNPELDDSVSIFGRKSVAPINFWTAQKIFNNKIHGSNPIAAHGKIRSINGGLQLNGHDSWLDAGDFFGQCLGDPDLCIKGFSYALQLNFDDDAKQYKDKRYVLDSSGGSRGVSVYIENGTVHYKVVTSGQTWDLATDLVSNEWQDIVLTWKKEEGLMLYVNGAFRDSQKESTATDPVPNKQARLTIGRKSGNPPYKYTRLYMSSLLAFTRFLAPEDIPYVFTYDDTVVPRYMWLLPKIENMAIPGSPDVAVHGSVKAVDGGVHLDGLDSYLNVGDFKGKCIHDPEKCIHGLSFSCKLKFDQVVRSYKKRHYILDSGGHKDGAKGLSAYLLNNNLYFDLAVSTPEDTLTWTVRTNIYTVRWQRVALTWSLEKGLWLYIDNQFRSHTERPRSKPRDVVPESSDFLIGRKNIGDETSPAEFSIGSIGIFDRFLDPEKKEIEKIFGGKKMPYPGLIREVWKELSGDSVAKLKDDPYFPNDPSLIEIIENFDSPFDVEEDYGTKVRGYFVAPETGNYTFYLAGSKSGELMLSKDESESNLTSLVNLDKPTGHNQWNKYAVQISATVSLEAGKYYYITALQKGTESTDSLSAGVRLPSGRFMRPISKEVLQWRLPGDPFAGVIRELWNDVSGYKITDLTSNPDFPNNPSSIEVLDKFDAPFNVGDNYGSRVRGFFKAPETGSYRFFLAADTTGELWLSSDESERNLRKIVTMTGWTEHNEWLKFREQKSGKIHLKKGQFYFMSVYHKADKLADCVSVAVEFPNGHFEGPIKKTHLSWRLPDGKTGPGPSFEQEAIPKPVGLFPFTKFYKGDDVSGNAENGVLNNVDLTTGPNDKDGGAYELKGTADSFVEIPNTGKLDTRHAMTILANIFPTGNGGPIVNYMTDGWGVHLWQFENNELFVRFVHRNGVFHKPIGSRVLQLGKWNQVGATYDNNTGVAQLWHNGKMVKSRNIGNIQLATQYSLRIGSRDGDDRHFAGKITCLQIYDNALDESQIGNLKSCPVKAKVSEDNEAGSGSGSGAWEGGQSEAAEIQPIHSTGKYDKDDEAEDEIQGTESGSASKCSPNPCENSAQCIRDSKRIDGYRCKCTSDFTGRDCQVSKPDAENPIVKRTKVPKAEKKESSTDFQKNSTATDIGDQLREEKKEDVFLLFQKIGCYNDEAVQHDLPDGLTLKSVSQEDCVRACALEEKGYSFFGLQNSDKCYCGHRYGKYGKADDAVCNMKCRDNSDENCGGKSSNVVYFFGLGTNYTVTAYTGDEEGADTNANVYITLYGEKGDSGFRKLSSKQHVRAKQDSETLLLPDLGKLKQVRVLHDNSGAAPSWYLDKLTVTDENGKVYNFPCKEWLSETQGGGKTERLLRLSSS